MHVPLPTSLAPEDKLPTPRVASLLLAGGLALVGCQAAATDVPPSTAAPGPTSAGVEAAPATTQADRADVPTVSHVHGLGFAPDGETLRVATHNGLRLWTNGTWSTPDVPSHDYMGFSAVDSGFYSSGHPGEGGLPNPLGVVRSLDGGASLETMSLQGEMDFHVMGAGYTSHALYAYVPNPGPSMSAGLHRSLDSGSTWEPRAAEGLPGPPASLAVHPTNPDEVAAGTESGLAVSSDGGQTFSLIHATSPASAVAYDPDDGALIFGFDGLWRAQDADSIEPLASSPSVTAGDPPASLAAAPTTDRLAVAYYSGDIYQSSDGGRTWSLIATGGS